MKITIKKHYKPILITTAIVIISVFLILLNIINLKTQEIDSLNDEISDNLNLARELRVERNHLNSEISKMQAEIKSLSKEEAKAKINAEIKSLEANIKTLEIKKTDTEKEVESLENKITALKDNIKKLEGDVIIAKDGPKQFPAGQFFVGANEDIKPGRYKISNGSSNFVARNYMDRLIINIILGSHGVNEYIHYFETGDMIEARSSFTLTPVK